MLKLEAFTMTKRGQTLTKSLDFQLRAGELLLISGPNGSGKTTLLKYLSGVSGEMPQLTWQGQALAKQSQFYPLFIEHSLGLKLTLTVHEMMYFYAIIQGNFSNEKINAALNYFDLYQKKNTLVASLSAGQKQRLALCRLMLGSSPLWLLDEPSSNLDSKGIDAFMQLIKRHLSQSGMVILTSHHLNLESISHVKVIQLG